MCAHVPIHKHCIAALHLQQSVHVPNTTGRAFGEVLQDVKVGGVAAGQVVSVEFQSASPRNDIRRNSTFLRVERLNDDTGDWDLVGVEVVVLVKSVSVASNT